jgi:hypothetical protein
VLSLPGFSFVKENPCAGVQIPPPVSRLHHIDSILAKAFLSIIYYQSDRSEASMRKTAFLKPLPFILFVMLCMTSLIVAVRAESWSWSKVASPELSEAIVKKRKREFSLWAFAKQ